MLRVGDIVEYEGYSGVWLGYTDNYGTGIVAFYDRYSSPKHSWSFNLCYGEIDHKYAISKIWWLSDRSRCKYVNENNLTKIENIGDDNMTNKFTVGTKVVAIKDSAKGIYNFGDMGIVKKFRDDEASVGVQLFKKKEGLTTWFKPENLCDLDSMDDVVEITVDGNGYYVGDIGVKIQDIYNGALIAIGKENPIYVPYSDYLAVEKVKVKTYKFYSLKTLRNKGFEFNSDGILTDGRYSILGFELNNIDGVFDGKEYDDYIEINGYGYDKDLLGVFFYEK